MQKVVGSSPIIRFNTTLAAAGVFVSPGSLVGESSASGSLSLPKSGDAGQDDESRLPAAKTGTLAPPTMNRF